MQHEQILRAGASSFHCTWHARRGAFISLFHFISLTVGFWKRFMQRITMSLAFLAMSVFFMNRFGYRPVLIVDRTAG
jgi:hypothetical protein